MVTRIGGSRRKTRDKLKRSLREKGKLHLRAYLQDFKPADRVLLKINSSVHEGMFFPRFHGKTGTVIDKAGDCYRVRVIDGAKPKIFYVHPAHLRRV